MWWTESTNRSSSWCGKREIVFLSISLKIAIHSLFVFSLLVKQQSGKMKTGSVSMNSSMHKNYIDFYWTFMKITQWMWVVKQLANFSEVVAKQTMFKTVVNSQNKEHFSQLNWANETWITERTSRRMGGQVALWTHS